MGDDILSINISKAPPGAKLKKTDAVPAHLIKYFNDKAMTGDLVEWTIGSMVYGGSQHDGADVGLEGTQIILFKFRLHAHGQAGAASGDIRTAEGVGYTPSQQWKNSSKPKEVYVKRMARLVVAKSKQSELWREGQGVAVELFN